MRIAVLLLAAALCASGARAAPIHDAAKSGDVARLSAAIQAQPQSVDVRDVEGNTALHIAALYGQTESARLLIAAGADVTATGAASYGVLHWAASGVDWYPP